MTDDEKELLRALLKFMVVVVTTILIGKSLAKEDERELA